MPRSCSGSSTVTDTNPPPETAPDIMIGLEWGKFAVYTLVTAHKLDLAEGRDEGPSDTSARLALAENLAQLASAHEAFGTALGAVMVNGSYARLVVLRPGLVAVESTAGAGTKRELRMALTAGPEGERAQTVADFCASSRVGSWPHQMRATELESAGAYLDWARRAVDQLRAYPVHGPPGRLFFTPWHGNGTGSSNGDTTPRADATPKAPTVRLEEPEEPMKANGTHAEEKGRDEEEDELPLGATARSFGVARTLRLLAEALSDWRAVAVSPGLIEQLADHVTRVP